MSKKVQEMTNFTVSTTPLPDKNELALTVESVGAGLEKTESQTLYEMFTAYFKRMSDIEVKIRAINAESPKKEDIAAARAIRLSLKENRIASEKTKDDLKASVLIRGRLIDALNNVIKNTSKGLEAQCEQIEKDAEIKEKARIEAIRESRAELLSPYIEDTSIFPLGTMTVDQFDTMLSGYKLAAQQKKEAAEKAEAERLEREAAEKLEQERIRKENARLQAEAEEREKAFAAERAEAARLAKIEADKQAAIRKAAEEEAARIKAENERKFREAVAEAERQQKELQKKQAEAEAERNQLQEELRKKQAEEAAEKARLAKMEADRKAAEEQAAKAPLKDKMKAAVNSLSLELPASNVTNDINSKFNGFKIWALQLIESL